MRSNDHRFFASVVTTLLATFIACPLSVVVCCDQNAKVQQPDSQKPPARDEHGRPTAGRGLLAEMTAFKTEVPAHVRHRAGAADTRLDDRQRRVL